MNAVTEVMDELRKALAELEDCRARNADLRTMLEQVTRERDQARDKYEALAVLVDGYRRERDEARADAERYLADLRRCASEPYERTRELEALQAEVEWLRETNDYLRTWLSSEELEGLRIKAAGHPLLWEEIHHLKDEVERLREMAHDFEAMREDRDEARAERDAAIARITEVGVMIATNGNRLAKDAYRRGAEAMREACAQWFREHDESFELTVDACHDVIADMPIPEEP